MALVYYIILIPVSWLPMPFLYGFSNFLYFMIYRVFGYRKEVVRKNLKNSFPDKSESEIRKITRTFYHHLMDLIVESVKVFSITRKKTHEKMVAINPELINTYFDQGRSVIIAGGHYGNWEMYAVAINDQIKHTPYAVYTPIKNKFLDRKMKESRGKFGLKMIPGKEVRRVITNAGENNEPVAIILATDQSPSNPDNAYWLEFLNQDTGVLFGTEKYATEFDLPVIYGAIEKVKRGHYRIEYKLITDTPRQTSYGDITRRHTSELEKTIKGKPDYWLWSHKRWKKKRPENANVPR